MYTKTGLRLHESRRNGDLSGGLSSIQKLPPIVATNNAASRAPHSYGSGGGGSVKVTERMLRARREAAKARFGSTAATATATAAAAVGRGEDRLVPASGGGRGRQELRLPTLPGRGKAGRVLARPKRGTSRGREKKGGGGGGGGRGGKDADSGARPVRKKPEWDGTMRDQSQFRLTPEEAMARKISLVSKHNTFAFGLGSDNRSSGGGDGDAGFSATTTPKEAVGPLSLEAARARSAKRVGERARKVADGEQRHHRRSRSEGGGSAPRGGKGAVSSPAPSGGGGDLTVSGNGEGGGDRETGGSNDLTMALYAARDNSSSQVIEGCDGPPSEAAAGRAGRARFDSGDSSANRSGNEGGGGVVASGLAGIEVGIKAFSRRVSRLETSTRTRFGAGGGHEDMEVGEKKRAVKLRVEQEGEGEGGRGGEEEETLTDWRIRTRTSGVEVTREEEADLCRLSGSSLREAAHPEDVASGERPRTPVRTASATAAVTDDDGCSTESGRKVHSSSENTWVHGEPSTTQPRRRGGRGGEGKFRGHSHGSKGVVGLVERVQALEEQVMQACLAPPRVPSTAAACETTDKKNTAGSGFLFCDDDTVAERKGQEAAAARSAEKMRFVVADLLSLTALLLERATMAEGRLAKLSEGRAAPAPDGVEVECDSATYDASAAQDSDLYNKALLVRARAEASILADDGNRPPGERDGAGTPSATAGAAHGDDDFSGVSGGGGGGGGGGGVGGGGGGGGGGGDTCPSPREWTQSDSSSFIEPPTDCFRAGRSLASRVTPSPAFHVKMAAAPPTTAKDCWSEALDTVGHLVESRHADGDDEVGVKLEVATPSPRTVSAAAAVRAPSSSFRGSPRRVASSAYPVVLPPLPGAVPTAAATAASTAAAAADCSPIRKTGPETPCSLGEQLPLPRPPPPLPVACATGGVSRPWGARDALAPLPIPGLSLADDMDSCCGPDFDFSAISTFEEENDEKEEEEDARSLPVCLAPSPTKKPEHPYQRTTPARSSPVLQHHVEQGGVSSDYAPAFTVGGGGGGVRSSPVLQQHVGQGGVSSDYAPAFTVVGGGGGGNSSISSARVYREGGGLEPPAIGQWYTPASEGSR